MKLSKKSIKVLIYSLLVFGLLAAFTVCAQTDVDIGIKPPNVTGADWKDDPFKYGIYLVFLAIKWAILIGLAMFLVKVIWGIITVYSEYMASRTGNGESGNNSKVGGLIGWFLGGVILWIIVYNIFGKLETVMQATFGS